MALDSEKIINGTHGEVWLDGEKCSDAFGLEARIEFNKEDIAICGKIGTDTKFMGFKGNGTVRLHKVNSRMAIKLSDKVKTGVNPRFQILSALNDPNAYGAERVVIKDASFNDLSLANWQANTNGEVEAPFTFTDWQYYDKITPKE